MEGISPTTLRDATRPFSCVLYESRKFFIIKMIEITSCDPVGEQLRVPRHQT